jgi:hypothetical protein
MLLPPAPSNKTPRRSTAGGNGKAEGRVRGRNKSRDDAVPKRNRVNPFRHGHQQETILELATPTAKEGVANPHDGKKRTGLTYPHSGEMFLSPGHAQPETPQDRPGPASTTPGRNVGTPSRRPRPGFVISMQSPVTGQDRDASSTGSVADHRTGEQGALHQDRTPRPRPANHRPTSKTSGPSTPADHEPGECRRGSPRPRPSRP